MAKQMSYTTPDGAPHPASYWRVVHVAIETVEGVARIMFHGYHDEAARRAGRAPIEQRSYSLTGADFPRWFGPEALSPAGVNPVWHAYALATATKEPDSGKSFFDGAQDV